ncbi:hypothetical protein ACIOUE_00840 [Streptomyces xanthochromogenes]|uniref:hypothetical protein n=1 Tax=Streptomyces xanthochromogenes TaxID=67384 RepID=UPI0037FB364D
MTDPTVTDLRRELEKARLALIDAQTHLSAHAQANAALHCASEVFYSPLHAKVTAAIQGVEHALARTDRPLPTLDPQSSDGPWAALVADLDRCEHGRHEGDDCGSCEGRSHGNPHLRPGAVIGYGLRGNRIVMPDRDHKHDPAAWRGKQP